MRKELASRNWGAMMSQFNFSSCKCSWPAPSQISQAGSLAYLHNETTQKVLRNVCPCPYSLQQFYYRALAPFLPHSSSKWGPLHTPAMQGGVSMKINSVLFSFKAGREDRGEACFGKIEKGVGFCWKYWHWCPSLIWKLSADADRSTCVWSGQVLSLWYIKKKLWGSSLKTC